MEFSAAEIKEDNREGGRVIVWGRSHQYRLPDDKLIKAEYALSIDPYSQMLASITGQKGAVGADAVVVDITCRAGHKAAHGRRRQGPWPRT